jgi:hypothetical protein
LAAFEVITEAGFLVFWFSGFLVINETGLPFPATGQQERFHDGVRHLI